LTSIDRIRVPWSGGRGGAGVSTFYALDASTALAPLRAFFDSVKSFVPSPITWKFDGVGDTITAETGVLAGSWSGTGPADVVATGSNANMADPVGFCVNWGTVDIRFGHRVRGRTFIVPCIKDAYDAGTLNDTIIPTIEAAGATLIAAVTSNLVVWTRPFLGTPAWTDVRGVTHPARAAHDGAVSTITTAFVPDLAVVLRSRRD
jgi:hypothetical protein